MIRTLKSIRVILLCVGFAIIGRGYIEYTFITGRFGLRLNVTPLGMYLLYALIIISVLNRVIGWTIRNFKNVKSTNAVKPNLPI